MIITIIGLGLIGGSMAIDLRKRKLATRLIGVESDPTHAQTALHMGLVDEVLELGEAIRDSDLIVLAVPADVTRHMLPDLLDQVDKQTVIDVCSVKKPIMEVIGHHPNRAQFVSTHPMAGTENSGPWAAISGLFDGKAVIFTDMDRSASASVNKARQLYDTLGMRPVVMNSLDHDIHVAYVSHISHISSFALALTVLEKEKDEKNILNLASGGFDSTVRLAKSNADMWVPIFGQNRHNVLEVLNTYIQKLDIFRLAIEGSDEEQVQKLILEANRIRKILN